MTLTPTGAAALYRKGMSACQIAQARGITGQGAEGPDPRRRGLGGYSDKPPSQLSQP